MIYFWYPSHSSQPLHTFPSSFSDMPHPLSYLSFSISHPLSRPPYPLASTFFIFHMVYRLRLRNILTLHLVDSFRSRDMDYVSRVKFKDIIQYVYNEFISTGMCWLQVSFTSQCVGLFKKNSTKWSDKYTYPSNLLLNTSNQACTTPSFAWNRIVRCGEPTGLCSTIWKVSIYFESRRSWIFKIAVFWITFNDKTGAYLQENTLSVKK